MDIRSSLDGLKSLLGVAPATGTTTEATLPTSGSSAGSGALGSDSATLSSAGSEVSLTASDSSVRTDKVVSVQAALASGTYDVPASAVATKVVDSMLVSEQ